MISSVPSLASSLAYSNASAGTVAFHHPWGAHSAGAGVQEDFNVILSQLEVEGVTFVNAVGKPASM